MSFSFIYRNLRTMEIQISLINSYLAFCFLFFFCDNVIAIRCIYICIKHPDLNVITIKIKTIAKCLLSMNAV